MLRPLVRMFGVSCPVYDVPQPLGSVPEEPGYESSLLIILPSGQYRRGSSRHQGGLETPLQLFAPNALSPLSSKLPVSIQSSISPLITCSLFHLVKGFVCGPFVQQSEAEELSFRSKLIDFYSEVIPEPSDISESACKLRSLLDDAKKENQLRKLSRLDLSGSSIHSESSRFDPNSLSAAMIANQITLIHSELYRQLLYSEILDLRFQKGKEHCEKLNLVHDFSNRVGLSTLNLLFLQ